MDMNQTLKDLIEFKKEADTKFKEMETKLE